MTNETGVTEETVKIVLVKKNRTKNPSLFYVAYLQQNTYFITVDITEDVVKSVAYKLLERLGTRARNQRVYREGY